MQANRMFNRPIVLIAFIILCGICAVWGGTYTMAILAVAAQPVNNYIQVIGKRRKDEKE